jgi:DNA modification methylase
MTGNAKHPSRSASDTLKKFERKVGPIEYRRTGTLTKCKRNPRRHSQEQIVKIMASVRKVDVVRPILISESAEIIAGEAVYEAACQLGLSEIPVVVARGWSKSQIKAYRLIDNRLAELAAWDEELLAIEIEEIIEFDDISIDLLGWETAEIDILLEGATGNDETSAQDPADATVDEPINPVTRSGDIWCLGEHRILCGSSLDAASWGALVGNHQPAMVFTDAPYNVPVDGHVCGLGKAKHQEFAMACGEMNSEQFETFLADAIEPMADTLRDGALLYLCMDWRHMGEMLKAIERCSLKLINLCVWNKNNGGMGSLYRSKHELVFVAKKGEARHTNNVELGRYGRYRTNVWDYAGINSFGATRDQDLADHPTVKPTALVADAIRDATQRGEIVLDAFLGSGTTILAAERTGRTGYGVEIEPRYVDVAIRRWETFTDKTATLAATGETAAEVAAARSANAESA